MVSRCCPTKMLKNSSSRMRQLVPIALPASLQPSVVECAPWAVGFRPTGLSRDQSLALTGGAHQWPQSLQTAYRVWSGPCAVVNNSFLKDL